MNRSCPHCPDSNLLRRKRTGFERLKFWQATLRPYRCSQCRHEQWLDRGIRDDQDIFLSLGILLASVAALGILAYGLIG